MYVIGFDERYAKFFNYSNLVIQKNSLGVYVSLSKCKALNKNFNKQVHNTLLTFDCTYYFILLKYTFLI